MDIDHICSTVSCPVGTYHNTTNDTCVTCPVDSYQDQEEQLSCKTCPTGSSTWGIEGARWVEYCTGNTNIINNTIIILISQIYIAHLSIWMLKCALQAITKPTVESLRSSTTAAHIHLYTKNALSRFVRPHNRYVVLSCFVIIVALCNSCRTL